VIPAYNEARRLPPYLDEVVSYLVTRGEAWEVVVVDDGSTDATSDVVRAMTARYPQVRLLRQEPNAGKGAAVRAGMLAARGSWRLARGRGGRELGGPAGEQGGRPQGRPTHAVADAGRAPPRRARGAQAVTAGAARRVRDIEPFLAVEVAERAGMLERSGVDVV